MVKQTLQLTNMLAELGMQNDFTDQ